MATYCPGLIFRLRSSSTQGRFSPYRKDTLLSSTAPDTRVMTCLPSAISGTASSMGFIMSSTGFICAAVSAMPESDMNAPVTMP